MVIKRSAVRREFVSLGFGKDFCQVAILVRDFWCSILRSSIERGQKLGEGRDGVEVQNIDLIVASDFRR